MKGDAGSKYMFRKSYTLERYSKLPNMDLLNRGLAQTVSIIFTILLNASIRCMLRENTTCYN